MTGYLIRAAVLRDAKAIAEVHSGAGSAHGTSGASGSPDNTPSIDRQQVFWREAIEFGEPQLHVACVENSVVGFVGFDRCRDKGSPPTMGEIWFTHVAQAHRGRGAGLQLWDRAREGLLEEGCLDVSVWIALGNDRALRFHELAGFKREMSSARTVPVHGGRVEEIRLQRKL